MAYHLNKSAVITGCVNSFCLTCDVFLTSQRDAEAHVNTTSHLSALGNATFADKFKDDHIWKFKWGYFCEFCNILLPIAAKVTVHIADENHKLNKLNILAKDKGNGVTFNNVYIEETSWHGLSEDICYICNVESDDQTKHRNDAKHCLNLVMKPVKSDEKNAFYREIDGTAIQCLTCNKLLSPDSKNAHFNSEEHQKMYDKCLLNAGNNIDVNNTNPNKDKVVPDCCKPEVTNANNNNHSPVTANKKKTKILDSISKYQRDSIQINLERDTAYCKKCLIVVDFDPDVIEDHIKKHSTTREVQSDLKYPTLDKVLNKMDIKEHLKPEVNGNKSDDDNVPSTSTSSPTLEHLDASESPDKIKFVDDFNDASSSTSVNSDIVGDIVVDIYAKANNITFNKGNSTAFCRTCEVKVPCSEYSMKEHVRGAAHKKKLAQIKPKKCEKKVNITKKKMTDFIQSQYTIELINEDHDIVINLKYCIHEDNFHMVCRNGFKKRCLVCSTDLQAYENVKEHSQKYTHLVAANKITVITSLESEFVREIKPDVYHCGFCNLIVTSWQDMENHLICTQHKQFKFASNYRLREHLPTIREHRAERRLETIALFHMLNMMGRPSRLPF